MFGRLESVFFFMLHMKINLIPCESFTWHFFDGLTLCLGTIVTCLCGCNAECMTFPQTKLFSLSFFFFQGVRMCKCDCFI